MDETNIQLDHPGKCLEYLFTSLVSKIQFKFKIRLFLKGSYTYEKKGSKNVNATTAGAEKTKISLAFTATANGSKLPILIVLPRKTPLKQPFVCPDNVIICYKPNSKTFDSGVLKEEFVERILKPHMMHTGKKKLLLLLDNSPVHKTKDLAVTLRVNNIQPSFFPPRMTSLLQPADVGWFRSLKSKYHVKWQNWFLNSPKAFTKSKNLKSPGYARVIKWVSQIWHEFEQELITKSFEATGITSHNPDDFNHLLRVVYDQEVMPTHQLVERELMDELEAFVSDRSDDEYEESDVSDESESDESENDENNKSGECESDESDTTGHERSNYGDAGEGDDNHDEDEDGSGGDDSGGSGSGDSDADDDDDDDEEDSSEEDSTDSGKF